MSDKLIDYIPDANKYISYFKAEELELNPQMWVDSLSDEHIEVHSTNTNGEMFCKELEKFLQKNYNHINIKMKNEIIIKNRKRYRVPYAILNLKDAIPNINQNCEIDC